MARLVTSDGVQVNLFLDLDSNNTGEGTLLYGPKSQPNMDFIVQGFKDFRTNTEFNNKNRLVFHCHHEITVYISSIMGVNYPTLSNPYVVDSETQLYYVGDDLVLSKTGTKIHRIDLFKSVSTDIDNVKSNISSNDSDIENLKNDVLVLQQGGGGGNNALYAPPQTLFLDTSLHNSIQTTSTRLYTYDGGGTATVKHTVAEFENFKTTHNDKYKLTFYSGTGYSEVLISDLINISPTSTNPLMFQYDNDGDDGEWKLYFDGNHLVLKMQRGGSVSGNHRYAVYRIDMHLNAFGGGVTTVNGQTGDVTLDTYTKTQVDAMITQLNDKITQSSGTGILWFHYPYNNAGNPQNDTQIMSALNSTYPPANYSPLKRLILHTNDAQGSGGDTQYLSKGYLFIRNETLEQWDFKGYINTSFDWSLMEPPN